MDKKKLSIIAIVLGVLFVAALVLFAVKDHQIKALADQDAGYQDVIQQYKNAKRTDWPDYITYQESMIEGVSFDAIKGITQIANDQATFAENEWNAVIGEAEPVKAAFAVDPMAVDILNYNNYSLGTAIIGDQEYSYFIIPGNGMILQENVLPEVTAVEDAVSVEVTAVEDAASVEVTAAEDAATVEVTAAEDAATAEPAADAAAAPVVLTYTYAINEDGTITLTPVEGAGEVITLTKTEAAAE